MSASRVDESKSKWNDNLFTLESENKRSNSSQNQFVDITRAVSNDKSDIELVLDIFWSRHTFRFASWAGIKNLKSEAFLNRNTKSKVTQINIVGKRSQTETKSENEVENESWAK